MCDVKTCGVCARMSKRDWEMKYCPFTAACVHKNRPASSCKLFLDKSEEAVTKEEVGDVCEG